MDPEPREREWQFDALDLRPVAAWVERAQVAGVAVVPRGEVEQEDAYYDTDDWRLHRAGLSVRIRHKPSGDEATLKSHPARDGALRDRLEISQAVRRRNGSLPTSGPVGDYVRLLCGRRGLRELVQTRTTRIRYDLEVDGTRAGELALDDTAIPVDGGEPARLLRVEVEVAGVEPDRLEPFVARLRQATNLVPAAGTKLEAGLFVRGLAPPAPADVGPTTVDPEGTIGEYAFAVLRRHHLAMLEHEPGTRLGADPEELHDMRVSIRRLRANLKLFAAALPARAERLRGELGWIAGELGAVRDLDVQLGREAEWAQMLAPPDGAALGPLAALLRARRDVARRALLRALDSRRYERLVRALGEFLRRGPNRTQPAAARPVRAALPELVAERHKRMRRAAGRIGRRSPAGDYHDLRILVKRHRYALEAAVPAYEPAGPVIKRLVALQDLLGAHQDADVGVAVLRELAAAELPAATVFAMGRLAERLDAEAAALRARFPKVLAKADGAEWKRLRGELRRGA